MCITIPTFQENMGGRGQPGWSDIVTSNIMAYSSAGVSLVPSSMSMSASDSPCMENHGASSNDVYSPWSSGEYISPKSSRLSGSITGAQQLSVVIYKYNLQAPRLLTRCAMDDSTWHGAVTE